MTTLDQYYIQHPEPTQSCLLALRDFIFAQNEQLTSACKWNVPCFYYGKRIVGYISIHKKHKLPYVGFWAGQQLDHPALLSEGRTLIKILLIDPTQDLPVGLLSDLFRQAIQIAANR